jgi:chemotaxis signal transduction protein
VEDAKNQAPAVERCLLVQAGEQLCAVPLGRVRRVVRALTVSPLPGAAIELLGLAEFGGEPLPVLDLALLVGAAPGEAPALPLTVVVMGGPDEASELAGLAVDAALDIVEVPLVAPTGKRRQVVAGEAVIADRPVRVLDLAALGQAS